MLPIVLGLLGLIAAPPPSPGASQKNLSAARFYYEVAFSESGSQAVMLAAKPGEFGAKRLEWIWLDLASGTHEVEAVDASGISELADSHASVLGLTQPQPGLAVAVLQSGSKRFLVSKERGALPSVSALPAALGADRLAIHGAVRANGGAVRILGGQEGHGVVIDVDRRGRVVFRTSIPIDDSTVVDAQPLPSGEIQLAGLSGLGARRPQTDSGAWTAVLTTSGSVSQFRDLPGASPRLMDLSGQVAVLLSTRTGLAVARLNGSDSSVQPIPAPADALCGVVRRSSGPAIIACAHGRDESLIRLHADARVQVTTRPQADSVRAPFLALQGGVVHEFTVMATDTGEALVWRIWP